MNGSIDHRFGTGPPFRVGIEEEVFLVDGETLALAHDAERVLTEGALSSELADHEAYASELELRSRPADTVAAAIGEVRAGRAAMRAAGATLLAAGLHPNASWGDTRLVAAERYAEVERTMRGLIHRTPECALHVHVAMPDAETAIRVYNALRAELPLLIALSANSPFWFGDDSQLASARYSHVRPYPRRGVPRALRDYAHYEEIVAAEAAAGAVRDYTFLWWDIRPHPNLGTVEVREMDAQARLDDTAALAALIRALALGAAHEPPRNLPPTEAISESCFRAARDGLDATILDQGGLRPASEMAREAVARALPHAREAGDESALEGIESILGGGNGAARQRSAHQEGGMRAVLDLLVRETAS